MAILGQVRHDNRMGISPRSLGISLRFRGSLDESDCSRTHIRGPLEFACFPHSQIFHMSSSSSYHTAPVYQGPGLSTGDHPWMNAVNNYQPASTEVRGSSPIGLILVLIVLLGWLLCLLRACLHRSQV